MHFENVAIFVLSVIIGSASLVDSYKYLAILPTAYKSHFIFASALLKALAEKGHEVHVVSAFPLLQQIPNYHDIPLMSVIEEMNDYTEGPDNLDKKNIAHNLNLITARTERVLMDPKVQQLMNKSSDTFDAVICEVFFSEALFGFSEYFEAPLIGLGTTGAVLWNTDMVGSPTPTSYVPGEGSSFTNRMTFKERAENFLTTGIERFLRNIFHLPRQAALYRYYFPHVERDMYEVRNDVAVVLLNSHVSMSYPRPSVPNQIEVAGMHIKRRRSPLPEDIEKFITKAKHGVVYFSMGSKLNSSNLSYDYKTKFIKAFANLKQRVLWKYEGRILKGKTSNILIRSWFPQDDILAHENVKVVITPVGFLSLTECVYHGKPIVGIPIVADQFSNMKRAENLGIGIGVSFKELNSKTLQAAVEQVINDKRYEDRAKEISEIYRDQPMLPLDLAVYWAEHVVRHQGGKYLHCAGLELNFIQYNNIDIFFLLFIMVIVFLYNFVVSFIALIKKILLFCWPQKAAKRKRN